MKTPSSSWQVRAAAERELRRRRAAATTPAAQPPPPEPVGALIRPRSLPQELFHESPADIRIIGGSVYGGKTWSLVFEPTQHFHVPGFNAVIFRRVVPEITNPGGLWDESLKWFPFYGGEPVAHKLEWRFPSGSRSKFAGLQYDTDTLDWKGAAICQLGFDQLEEFSAHQFWYMLSRNRSICGVPPRVIASCNPDPDSFVADLVAWWIDQESGYAIPERSGTVRWFVRVNDTLVWADTREELFEKYPDLDEHGPRSLTFILARLQDNKVGLEKDPAYKARVQAMPYVEQERLLGGDRGGNWKIRAAAGLVFDIAKFGAPVDAAPVQARRIRSWDKAATPGGGDWTAGVKLAIGPDKTIYIEDVVRGRWGSGDREAVIHQTASVVDTKSVPIFLEQEPGSGGKDSAASSIKMLQGWTVSAAPSTGDKVARAGPLAAQVKAGNVKIVKGAWNTEFLRELHAFPTKGVPDDQVDAAALGFNQLTLHTPGPAIPFKVRF